ncbi:hypothetical protein V7S43_000216 [Phytophthora oleae]|uniref:Uncharacterized protein n=1 Tax=Phytophthora oleae TaxID=2107226 RepID=A0ABD3G8B3_9STRA
MWPWIDEFARAVESNATALDTVPAREEAADKAIAVLTEAGKIKEPTAKQDEELFRLLDACRMFMRDRRGIDKLLSAEALDILLMLSENLSWSSRVREESLKCIVNLVYSRPEFVSGILVPKRFITRLLVIATFGGTASMHWLAWKVLLVSCEAPEVPRFLSSSLDAWQLIHGTIFYTFKHGNQLEIIDGARATLLIDLVKLVTVLVNDTQWTAEQEKLMPALFRTIHKLGGLLLEILRFKHPDISPLNENLVELKSKAMEMFMFLPGNLLAAFVQQQHKENSSSKESLLFPVLDHLHTMLLATRIEKTRPLKDMLPTLIVCYNLAKTGDPDILTCFKQTILPTMQSESAFERTKALFFMQLKFFFTCLDTDVRRYTSEWLFLLSDENGKCLQLFIVASRVVQLLSFSKFADPSENNNNNSPCVFSEDVHAPHRRGERNRLAAHERSRLRPPRRSPALNIPDAAHGKHSLLANVAAHAHLL